jgi:hypothetical protein
MTLITNTTVGFMKQKLNKAKKYKEQERLANLAIASAWARGCTLRQPQTKGLVLAGFTVQHFESQQSAESTHQDKHFNYNLQLNILGIL